mgnify:CR=1 FL=1
METNNSKQKKNSYRDNFKTTILFSFVQIYQIFIRIVRSKFVAMFLGPEGMGITSLLHSTTDLISASTNMGLKTSGVRSVAAANSLQDQAKIAEISTVVRRLIMITGLFGMLICACFSPLWSLNSFGNYDYTWAFVIVSVVILLDQLNYGELVLLQGLQKRTFLAKANIIGQTISLFVIVPLYYFFRVKAIVWVLVIASLTTFIISKCYTKRLNIPKVHVTFREVFSLGREMIKLGVLLSIQHMMAQLSMYIVRNYVSQVGSLTDVGLYSAGSTIINLYLSLVFTAMATDYFPRLSKTKNNEELHNTIQQQAEITIFLFAPIIVLFIVFIKPVILLLYSEEFLPIEMMLYFAMGATLIKALAWSQSYSIVAKAKAKVYFWNEVVAITNNLILNILGYKLFGLTGFGISIVIGYILYLIQVSCVTKKYFNFSFSSIIWKYFIILNIFVVASLVSKIALSNFWGYIFGSIIFMICLCYSYRELDKRVGIKDALINKFRK